MPHIVIPIFGWSIKIKIILFSALNRALSILIDMTPTGSRFVTLLALANTLITGTVINSFLHWAFTYVFHLLYSIACTSTAVCGILVTYIQYISKQM